MKTPIVPFRLLKQLVARVITHPVVGWCVGVMHAERIPFHGRRIDVRGAAIPNATKAALFWGAYESAEFRFVTKYLSPHLPVIEVGSSIGAISSVIAGILHAGNRLTCVEANPVLISALERNLSQHASHLRVSVVNAAIGSQRGITAFHVSGNNLVSSLGDPASRGVIDIECTTLADLVAQAGGEPWQLVADIEGAEVEMLASNPDAWAGCTALIMELHDTRWKDKPVFRADLTRMICGLGFEIVDTYGAVVACRRR